MKNKVLLLIITILLVLSFLVSCVDTEGSNIKTEPKEETVTLTSDNFYDYFNVSVEYYNFEKEDHDGQTILGVYVSGYYEATVSERIKISPKDNVISCNNVEIKQRHIYPWSYTASNSSHEFENSDNNYWSFTLPSNGIFDSSKTVYYFSNNRSATCPVPSSRLDFKYVYDVSGDITIKK